MRRHEIVMPCWVRVLMCWAVLCPLLSMGQTTVLDMKGLHNKTYHLDAPGVSESGFCSDVLSFESSGPGSCLLRLNADEGGGCYVRFDVDVDGAVSNLQWKDADSSQTGGGWDTLDVALYTLEGSGKTLTLTGTTVTVDFVKIGTIAMHVPQLTNGSQPSATRVLMPGDYTLTGPNYPGTIYWEVDPNGEFPATLKWNYPTLNGSSLEVLGSTYHLITNVSHKLTLQGREVTWDLTQMPAGFMTFSLLAQGQNVATAGGQVVQELLPGRYTGQYLVVQGKTQTLMGTFRLEVGNTNGEISPPLMWMAPNTQTYASYDPVNHYLTPSEVHLLEVPGVNSSQRAEGNAASLQSTLDGATYDTDNGVLRFQFLEEYASAALNWAIYDHQRQDVSPAVTLPDTHPGMNVFEVNVSSLGAGTYLLEVTGQKAEKFYLRFKKS